MATEITARLYFDSEPAPARVFSQLIEAVSAWREGNAPWQGLRVHAGARREAVFRDDAPLDTGALAALAARFGETSQQLSTRTSYDCWRFQGRTPVAGSSLAWVEAWGDEYGRDRGEDVRRIWGSATFTISDCGPYCAIIDARDAAAAVANEAVNERVEDNLDRLTKLIFRIVEAVEPASLKVFTDQGAFLPFNAHLAYHASEARVLEDVRLIAELWQTGLPRQVRQLQRAARLRPARLSALHERVPRSLLPRAPRRLTTGATAARHRGRATARGRAVTTNDERRAVHTGQTGDRRLAKIASGH
jgi:hypothetical protein